MLTKSLYTIKLLRKVTHNSNNWSRAEFNIRRNSHSTLRSIVDHLIGQFAPLEKPLQENDIAVTRDQEEERPIHLN